MPSIRTMRIQNAVFLACAFAFLVFAMFPGRLDGDAIWQYRQGLAFNFDDAHSVINAALMGVMSDIVPGPGPMFVLQLVLWIGGLLLFTDALIASGRPLTGQAASLLALSPLLSFDFFDVQKDAMLSGLLAVFLGVAAGLGLKGRRVGLIGGAALFALLVFALDTRQNAVFVLAPLWFLYWPVTGLKLRPVLVSLLAGVVVFASANAVRVWIDRSVLQTHRSHLVYALQLYDLAGISARTGQDASEGVLPDFRANAARCYNPHQWDDFLAGACQPVGLYAQRGIEDRDFRKTLARVWVREIARHPGAYLAHRAQHFGCLIRLGCMGAGQMNAFWSPRSWDEPGMRVTVAARALGAVAIPSWRGLPGSGVLWIAILLAELAVSAWLLRRNGFAPTAYVGAVAAAAGLIYLAPFAVIGVADQLRYLHPVMFLGVVGAPLAVGGLVQARPSLSAVFERLAELRRRPSRPAVPAGAEAAREAVSS